MIPVPLLLAGAAGLLLLGARMTSRSSPSPSPSPGPSASDEYLIEGLDVSQYQTDGSIDWQAGHDAGFVFVMIRSGYGSRPDPLTITHIQKARAAGWTVGLYHFVTEAPIEAQWQNLLAQSKLAGIGPGDVGPMFDLEWLDGKGKMPSDIPGYLAIVRELIARSIATWGKAWIYTAPGFWQSVGSPHEWLAWPWMIAKWGKNPPADNPVRWMAWQAGSFTPAWSRGALDHDKARELPIIPSPIVSGEDDSDPDSSDSEAA